MVTEEVLLRKGRLVVGVDGSPHSMKALEWAARNAERMGCSIEAIAVWERYIPPGDLIAAGMPLGSLMPDISPDVSASRVLEEATVKAFPKARPLDLKMRTVEGDPAHVLIDESKTATMLILGSSGHGQLYNLVLGSVSASCAARAHCPVLIIHDRDET